MADRAISELTPVTSVTPSDSFVLEQNNRAMRLTGQVLLNWLLVAMDGHGGINKIEKTGTNVLEDTYTITYADETTSTFTVTNGRSITGVAKTATSGLEDTYTISYSDNTKSTFVVKNGANGDKGDNTYAWVKYSENRPTRDADMKDEPDNWFGIYTGNSSTPPTTYTSYSWFMIKGEKGDTGTPSSVSVTSVLYAVGTSGTTAPPLSSFHEYVPSVTPGNYLWTRIYIEFNSGDPITAYSVTKAGLDGQGTVNSVNGITPDTSYNVQLLIFEDNMMYIGDNKVYSADSQLDAVVDNGVRYLVHDAGAVRSVNGITPDATGNVKAGGDMLPIDFGTVSSLPKTVNNNLITSDMSLVKYEASNDDAIMTDWTVTTSTGSVTVSGTIQGTTTLKLYFLGVQS